MFLISIERYIPAHRSNGYFQSAVPWEYKNSKHFIDGDDDNVDDDGDDDDDDDDDDEKIDSLSFNIRIGLSQTLDPGWEYTIPSL